MPKPQPSFRSGFIGLIGRPNVGKSTLLNQLVGQKIAITSPVMQTTRHRIKGVVTLKAGQLIFLDTPGFAKAFNEKDHLGHYLTDEGLAALNEADALIMVVDGTEPPGRGDIWIAEQLRASGKFILLVINKIDRLKSNPKKHNSHKVLYEELLKGYQKKPDQPGEASYQVIGISAKTGKHVNQIAELMLGHLPEGPAYYDADSVTDQRIREIAAEMIREQVLHLTREELPHSVAVGINTFKEDQPSKQGPITKIEAILYVDQESQKAIVIGQNGQMIKNIGTRARKQLEELTEGRIHLALEVKVKKNWRKDPKFLKALGLALPEKS